MTEEKKRIKLYTKSGDKGKTSLYDGTRRYKEDYIFDVLGTIDELNCHIGMLAVMEPSISIRILQYKLTRINSIIATPQKNKNIPNITVQDITFLEKAIDNLQQLTPPLKEFVLPGSTPSNSQCHICRAVSRRAERMVSRLFHNGGQPFTNGDRIVPNKNLPKNKKNILIWFNRLSDFFFALSRFLALSKPEITMSEMESSPELTILQLQ